MAPATGHGEALRGCRWAGSLRARTPRCCPAACAHTRKGGKRRRREAVFLPAAVMNGNHIPYTPVAVDLWRVTKIPSARIFFLSHMHADHTSGLTPTWCRPIYCSPITAKLLKHKFHIADRFIHPLELDESHCVPLDGVGKETMTVTLIDANHCPGAVMFLFQGYFGNILYTGDFRFIPQMLQLPLLNTITIDVLYLDNTYCPSKWHFPSREEATEEIKKIIRNHPEHRVVIGTYSLGKESLLVELAMEFGWIGVSPERMETLRLLGQPDVFTTAAEECRLKVVDAHRVSGRSVARWNDERPTIAVLPSGNRAGRRKSDSVFIVPYSDHSSYGELRRFVAGLRPRAVRPIEKGLGCEGYFGEFLSTEEGGQSDATIVIPESVQSFMLGGNVFARGNTFFLKRNPPPSRRRFRKGVCFDSPGSANATSFPPCIVVSSSDVDDKDGDDDYMLITKNEDDASLPFPSEAIVIYSSFDNGSISKTKSKEINDTTYIHELANGDAVQSHSGKSTVKMKLDFEKSLSLESFTKHITCVEETDSLNSSQFHSGLLSHPALSYDSTSDQICANEQQGAVKEALFLTKSPKPADDACVVGKVQRTSEGHPVDFHTPVMGGRRHSDILQKKVQGSSHTAAGKCHIRLSPLHAFLSEKEKRLRFDLLVEKCIQRK